MYDPALIAELQADFVGMRRRLRDALGAGADRNVAAAHIRDDLDARTGAIVRTLGVLAGQPRLPTIVEGRRA